MGRPKRQVQSKPEEKNKPDKNVFEELWEDDANITRKPPPRRKRPHSDQEDS